MPMPAHFKAPCFAILSLNCVKVCKNYANYQTVPYKEAYVAVDEVDQYGFLDYIYISIKEKRALGGRTFCHDVLYFILHVRLC